MITNTTDFIELLAEEGFELYNDNLDIKTNRVTAPLNSDLSDWVEIEKIVTKNENQYL